MAKKKTDTAAATGEPKASGRTAQKAVGKFDGWNLIHEQDPVVTSAQGPAGSAQSITPGHFIAVKRADPNTLVEMAAETPERLASMIEDWERSRPVESQPPPTEEQVMNSAKATLHMATTAAARPALDAVVPQASEKKPARARRLAVKPQIEEVELSQADQELIAAGQPESDFAGVGPA